MKVMSPEHPLSPPPGLGFAEEIMTAEEEAKLIALIESSGLLPAPTDPDKTRSTKTYGWVYEIRDESIWLGEPLPSGFHAVRDYAAAFAGVAPESFIECMLIRYEPGAIIPPHLDKPAWKNVIGISLGSATTMKFRKAEGEDYRHAEARLPPRSIYWLTGEARHSYQHSIPSVEERRWSITFRDFSDQGLSMRLKALSGAKP